MLCLYSYLAIVCQGKIKVFQPRNGCLLVTSTSDIHTIHTTHMIHTIRPRSLCAISEKNRNLRIGKNIFRGWLPKMRGPANCNSTKTLRRKNKSWWLHRNSRMMATLGYSTSRDISEMLPIVKNNAQFRPFLRFLTAIPKKTSEASLR